MTFDDYCAEVRGTMDGKAKDKNYSQNGVDGQNKLYEFVRDTVGGHEHGHALGEMIYKVVRFARKGNDEDLVKAAAWGFLVLQHKHRKKDADHKTLIASMAGTGETAAYLNQKVTYTRSDY